MPFGFINSLARHRVGILVQVLSAIEDTVRRGQTSQEERWTHFQSRNPSVDEEQDYGDFLSDQRAELETVLLEGRLFHIVALYHTVENALGRFFRWRLSGIAPADRAEILKTLHRWKELGDLTNMYFGFGIASVPGFATVNRLRLITNAVKHEGGRVSRELHKVTRWKRGQAIAPTRVDLPKARALCLRFLKLYGERAQRGTEKKYPRAPGNVPPPVEWS
jgi:hypothetical protein